ncbi:MAG: hypothetical protein PUB05_02330 [Firmicutes bacterium]|nr:hypothetical protein [Bacillota bacterium]
MAFCSQCGNQVDDKAVICPACGCAVNGSAGIVTAPTTNERVASAFGYLGILVLIPLLAFKDSKFCRFHANQSLVLLIIDVVISAAGKIIGLIPYVGSVIGWVFSLAGIAVAVFGIMGIVYAAQGKEQELPLIGQIKLLK